MNLRRSARKLKRFFKRTKRLKNPQLVVDWVNTQGWESEIYAYTLTHGPRRARQTETGVMRLLTGADFEAAQSEYRTLSLLFRAGYPVPQVFALGAPGDGFKHPFILMQRIEGGDFYSRFPKTTADDPKPLHDFIGLFRSLHTLNWQLYLENPDEISPPDQPFYHFDRKLARFSQYISTAGLTAFDPVIEWLREHRERAACSRASVTHQDFHPNNILQDSQGYLYVVDWTSAEISDYRFDLAWTLALSLAYGGDIPRKMVLAEYERQMGAKVPNLEVFEVTACLRRIGSAMISMQTGAEQMGMRPEAAAVMQRDRAAFERLADRLAAITKLELPGISAWVKTLG